MQKIYAGKQLEILYAQAAQVDKLSAFDHIDRAASAFERELLRYYTLGGRTIYVFAGAGRCGAYALAIAQLLARRGHSVLTYLFYLPMSFLIPSSSGLASATMGIMAPLGEFVNVKASLIITAYQSASGVLNLITPTSGIVMGALALGRISLGTWWKFVAKLIITIVIVSMLLLILGTFLPFL